MNGLPTYPPGTARTAAHVLVAVLPPGTTPIYRSDWLTPYTAQTIADDALRAGHGTQLDVTVPAAADDTVLEGVRDELGWLCGRGIHLRVHRAVPE